VEGTGEPAPMKTILCAILLAAGPSSHDAIEALAFRD
jgi:hypothetical protein